MAEVCAGVSLSQLSIRLKVVRTKLMLALRFALLMYISRRFYSSTKVDIGSVGPL